MPPPTLTHNIPNQRVSQEIIRGNRTSSLERAPCNISDARWFNSLLHRMFSENEEVTSISFYPREFHPIGIPYIDDYLVEWTGPYTPANFTEMDLMRYLAHHINADRFRWKEIDLNFSFGGPLRHRVGSTDNSQRGFVTFGPFPRMERLLLTAPTDCFTVLPSHLDLSDSHQLRTLSLLGDWHFYDSLRSIAPNGTPALPSLYTGACPRG